MAIDADQRLKIELICNGIEEQGISADVTKWERDFMADQAERLETYGERMFVSDKQWAIIDRIYEKVVI
jgi:hypothetical protein